MRKPETCTSDLGRMGSPKACGRPLELVAFHEKGSIGQVALCPRCDGPTLKQMNSRVR